MGALVVIGAFYGWVLESPDDPEAHTDGHELQVSGNGSEVSISGNGSGQETESALAASEVSEEIAGKSND